MIYTEEKRKKIAATLQTTATILTGNAILAFAVAAFIIPHDILSGGTTGIGIVLGKLFPIDTAFFILVLNLLFLIFGGIVLGKKFFLTTVASSILYPLFLELFQSISGIESLTENSLLACLFAGSLYGISIGMLMRIGSSTGGVDALNLALSKWTHRSVSVFVYLTDFIIIGWQALFNSSEKILLGILTIVIQSLVLEQVMLLGKAQIQIFVISEKYEELRLKFLNEIQAGITMLPIETGCLVQQQKGVLCITQPRKLYAATEMIQAIDPQAFITVTKVKEVRGRGFTLEREMQTPIQHSSNS
jgi:uncharacterized membrane-anchored protein YitT (DUF2179 family)